MTLERSLEPARKLTFIHTVATLEPMFARLAEERLLGWEIASIADESLLARTIQNGKVVQETAEALAARVQSAEGAGSDAIVVTCSTLRCGRHTLRKDRNATLPHRPRDGREGSAARFEHGILATLPTTLDPTTRLLQQTTDRLGRRCKFVARLCSDAFAHLKSGDTQTHDTLIRSDYEILSTV